MDYIESKGKTVDEAVFNGLIKMDWSIDEVDIEILDEGSGLFKNAKVKLTKKEDASVPGVIETTEEKAAGPAPEAVQTRADRSAPGSSAPGSSAPGPSASGFTVGRAQAAPAYGTMGRVSPLSSRIRRTRLRCFCLGLFKHMGIQVALQSITEDGVLKIDMSGHTMGMLIGRRGETLDALQYLTSLVLNNGKEDYTKVMLDTENYRSKREETLKRLAARLADKVQRSGKRVVLEPMNPYERRIMHATLQDYSKVYTYSEGEDPFRSVVVELKSKKRPSADAK